MPTTHLPLAQFFTRDIHRSINGVVKAEQHDADIQRQELDEYVITDELDRHFRSFYRYFNHSESGDKNGIWISGFFGSGKSHFLKMLGYLLKNDTGTLDTKPLEFFRDKVTDPMLWAEMNKPLDYDLEVALFNIDSKARSSNTQKDSILSVFWRVFDDMRGYFGEAPHIAQMEAHLDSEGLYESFCQSFERIKGDSWHNKRSGYAFLATPIAQALQEVTGQSEAEAKQTLKTLKAGVDERSVESFAKALKDYLARDSRKPRRLVFLVDEVGQYIGDDAQLMLNLQTVVEDLNIHCQGQAWVIVTSQEDIDSILLQVNQARRNDFSKIQGRFYTPLSLSSANTDEVIKKRLLTKTDTASDSLQAFYGNQEANLNNLVSFTDSSFFPRYKDSKDFVDTYPFLPYQFTLLQEVLRTLRESGSSGRHMAEGERSMLDMFQLTLKNLEDRELGVLVPFYHFYAAIHGFLDHTIRRVFEQAQHNERLQDPFDLNLLKILFMVRWVEKFKPNQDNLLTLMIDHVDIDKAQLRVQVQESLERLEQQTLIQRNGDAYYFLTNEQQEIMRSIKALAVDPIEVNQKLAKIMWSQLFLSTKLKYDARHSYDFRRKLDDQEASASKKAALLLQVITPAGSSYDVYREDAYCMGQTQDMESIIVRLPEAKGLYAQVQQVLQTEQYFLRHSSSEGSTHMKKMREQINEDKIQREKELVKHLEQLVCQADVFAGGEKQQNLNRQSVKLLCEEALSSLVQAVYNKLDLVGRHYASEAEVDAVFNSDGKMKNALPEHDGNAAARSAMLDWCSDQQEVRGQTITLDTLLDRFSNRSFGWAELDILGILAELMGSGKLELRKNKERVTPGKGTARQLLSGSGRKSFVVRLQRQVSTAVLNTAKALYKESAEGKSPDSDPEGLFRQYQNLLPQQLKQLQDFASHSQPRYPFHKELLDYVALLSTLIEADTHQDLFETLHKRADDYDDYLDDLRDLNSFYTHQRDVFDKQMALLSRLAPEMGHIQDATLKGNYEKAQEMMSTGDRRILQNMPQVGHMLDPVEARLTELLQEKRDSVTAAIAQSLESLKATYREDVDSLSSYWQRWQDLQTEVDQASSMDTLVARHTRIGSLEQQVHDHITAQIEHAKEKAAVFDDAETPAVTPTSSVSKPASKPVETLSVVSLAPKRLIETEDDVDAYLDKLGATLRKHLRQNKRVQLK